ncbi:hypothetical protein FN846DRAFT_908115 [Sphaerosporella brunnea]|uniref:Uncharacterized protein n=1 Tax=Sphaerosporella brunnea TaxID=1250544 RepID=A0A5J5EVD7_9PEZI|nr:hypothetical protein FN846DRAFT_908115 [Sphaerosporella brunnea]
MPGRKKKDVFPADAADMRDGQHAVWHHQDNTHQVNPPERPQWCKTEFPKAAMRRHMLAWRRNYYRQVSKSYVPVRYGDGEAVHLFDYECDSKIGDQWTTQSGALGHRARVRRDGLETDENHSEKERNKRRVVIPPGNGEDALPMRGLVAPPQVPAGAQSLRDAVVEKDSQLQSSRGLHEEKDRQIAALEALLQSCQTELTDKERGVKELQAEHTKQQEMLTAANEQIAYQRQVTNNQEKVIMHMRNQGRQIKLGLRRELAARGANRGAGPRGKRGPTK